MDLMTAETLIVHDAERVLCQPCLRIVLFGYALDATPSLLSPLNAFVRRFEKNVGWYYNDFHQTKPKRWSKGKSDDVLENMRNDIASPNGAIAQLLAPSKQGEWLVPAFYYWKSSGISEPFVMISLPLGWLQDVGSNGVDSVLREILDDDFPLSSGYVGLSTHLNYSRLSDEARLAVFFRKWLTEFPELMHPIPQMQKQYARAGLVDVGWYTLLGGALSKKAGSIEHVLSQIPTAIRPEIQIEEFSGGALAIRAGIAPTLTGNAANVPQSLQNAVGAALTSLCDLDKNGEQLVPGFDKDGEFDKRRQWANRFFYAV